MVESGQSGADQPVVKPRLIRFLKNRRKFIGGDVRNELWEEVDRRVTERRKPDTAAERVVQNAIQEVSEASFPVAKGRIRDRLANANENTLSRL